MSEIRIIWIRTPKTGSKSVLRMLRDAGLCKANPRADSHVLMIDGGRGRRFRHHRPVVWKSAFRFAVVRNPWDRLVSGWKFAAPEHSLESLLRNPPGRERFHVWHHITRPQSDFILDENGGHMAHWLIRFENLAEDLEQMWQVLDLEPMKLPHIGPSQRKKDYRQYFTDETRELARRHFQVDIETLGYEF